MEKTKEEKIAFLKDSIEKFKETLSDIEKKEQEIKIEIDRLEEKLRPVIMRKGSLLGGIGEFIEELERVEGKE